MLHHVVFQGIAFLEEVLLGDLAEVVPPHLESHNTSHQTNILSCLEFIPCNHPDFDFSFDKSRNSLMNLILKTVLYRSGPEQNKITLYLLG